VKIGKVTSQTTSLITSAVQMGIERNLKILIVDASFRDEMMKKAFLQDESNDELIKISSELVKDRGYFYLVHRADRLSEILNILQKYKFEAKKIKFCYTTKYKNAKIVLIEAIKNGKSGLTILPPLIINKENGEYTDEVLKMFE